MDKFNKLKTKETNDIDYYYLLLNPMNGSFFGLPIIDFDFLFELTWHINIFCLLISGKNVDDIVFNNINGDNIHRPSISKSNERISY